MKEQVYLGIDLGAESGRVMAGLWNGTVIRLEELHRFPTGGVEIAGTQRWDVLRIWQEIERGLTVAGRKYGTSIVSIGVDTWGVDFVLLSKHEEMLGLPYHYRDPKNRGMLEEAFKRVPRREIFAQSGLQFMEINTLYQLLALQKKSPGLLESAESLLMIPDFINWCLCGEKVVEFTNATTTQLVDPTTRDWSHDLLNRFGIPARIFPRIVQPGTKLAPLRQTVADKTGLPRVPVIAPATHDTASAVIGVPTANTGRSTWAYLSSGTWSLLGAEVARAQMSAITLELNFTNEGGIDGTYRLLKNIMGLWLVQSCKRVFEAEGRAYDYNSLVDLAEASGPARAIVDPDDPRFIHPPNMAQTIQDVCRDTKQPVPQNDGEIVRCAFESLADKYRKVLSSVEELVANKIDVLHIVGGGSRNVLLNRLTARACKCAVVAGPTEATVLGNLLVQARAAGELQSLAEIRSVVRASSQVQEFLPS